MTPEYTLIRTRRRTVQIQVDRTGAVTVRAPHRVPRQDIAAFVADKADWIARARSAQQARAAQAYRLTAADIALLREGARAVLPALTAQWAARMGVAPAGVTITAAARRWGSCSGRDRISYSLRVMLLPPELREYIVVHELSHIRQKNHSPAFYAEAARFLPDFRARQDALRAWERAHPIETE